MYIELAELADRPGAEELSQVATPRPHRAVETALLDALLRGEPLSDWAAEQIELATKALDVIVGAVNDAQGYIDGFLSRRGYTLPLSKRYGVVTGWARAIARYQLHKDRLSNEKDDPIVRDYRDAVKFLQLVAEGKFSLGIEDPLTPAGGGAPEFRTPPRIFSDRTLKDF